MDDEVLKGIATKLCIDRPAGASDGDTWVLKSPSVKDVTDALIYVRDETMKTAAFRQTYTYIGKNGKAVLARDLEDERDRLKGEIEKLNSHIEDTHWAMNKTLKNKKATNGKLLRLVEKAKQNGFLPGFEFNHGAENGGDDSF